MQFRPAASADLGSVQAIYAHHVLHGLGTFETEAPDLAEMQSRYTQVTAAGFPYLVAESSGRVLGYAYANHFRARAAYRHTVEDSIYVAPDAAGQGIGKLLLSALVDRCAALGFRQMLALIGDSGNVASIGVHRACGFHHAGMMQAVGRKLDRWVDVVIMQRALGAAVTAAPVPHQ
jgi:L-amino acid N-acyltransferase YncA